MAQAIRPLDNHPAFRGDPGDFLLIGFPLSTILGEAGGIDDGRTNVAVSQSAKRGNDSVARNCEHRSVDTLGEIAAHLRAVSAGRAGAAAGARA